MARQKSQSEIEVEIARLKSQIRQYDECVKALVIVQGTWEGLNKGTRKVFEWSTSDSYDRLLNALKRSDELIKDLKKLLGRTREQRAKLKKELKVSKMQAAERNHFGTPQSK